MTNRAERRQAARLELASKTKADDRPPLCAPGRHAFGRVSATYRGVEVAVRVVCNRCRRLVEQVFREQPETFDAYRAWLADEKLDAAHQAQIQPAHYRR